MDSSSPVTHIGLCAGYGGIELGLKRAIPNLRSIALCEIEAFAIANLVSKMEAGLMDPAPIWPDLKTFPWEAFRDRVDILTGGYPCQPFSAAGQRKGKQDPRHLWPFIADGIRLLRPKLCFFENVEGHISLGLSDVIEDLAGMGYRTTWGIFSAAECGAPHQRKRVFILAISSSLGGSAGLSGPFPWHEGQSGEPDDGGGEVLADAERNGRRASTGNAGTMGAAQCSQEGGESKPRTTASSAYGGCDSPAWPSRPGEQQYGWEPPRVVSGNTRRELDDASRNRHGKDDAVPAGREGTVDAGSSGAMGDSDHGRQPSGIDTGSCTEASGGGQGDVEQADGGMGDTEGGTRLGSTQRTAGHAAQSDQAMADTIGGWGQQAGSECRSGEVAADSGYQESSRDSQTVVSDDQGGNAADRQAQPPLGGDADGSAGGMDYAELCVSGDNRTDELRLLGNGVVPATAERAFVSLMRELDSNQAGS